MDPHRKQNLEKKGAREKAAAEKARAENQSSQQPRVNLLLGPRVSRTQLSGNSFPPGAVGLDS